MLSPEDRSTLLRLARDAVRAAARGQPPPGLQAAGTLAQPGAAFVTLRRRGELRGCIGHTRAIEPLWISVRDMAAASAARDPRFPPVAPDEVPGLGVEISVLSPMQRVRGEEDVLVGRDGLYIKRGNAAGLLLPHVAVEQGWNPCRFLEQACRKAELPPAAWQEPGTEIYTFSAELFGDPGEGPDP